MELYSWCFETLYRYVGVRRVGVLGSWVENLGYSLRIWGKGSWVFMWRCQVTRLWSGDKWMMKRGVVLQSIAA